MCRLAAFYTERPSLLAEVIEALVASAEDDPLLARVSRGRVRSHGDGWGYAVCMWRGDSLSCLERRSTIPIYLERGEVERLSDLLGSSDRVVGVIHARKASRGEPVTLADTHPFHLVGADGSELWLVHNGGVFKEQLARARGLEWLRERADSMVLAAHIASRMPDMRGALLEAMGFTKSALNLGLLVLRGSKTVLHVLAYAVESLDEDRKRYYRLYVSRGYGHVVYLSSTLAEVYGVSGSPLENRYYAEISDRGVLETTLISND